MRPESMSNEPRLLIAHVIKGEVQLDAAVEHRSRASASPVMSPALDLDALIWPRRDPGPAFETPLAEIVDFLVEVGKALDFDKNAHLQEAAALNLHCNSLGARILENCYRDIGWFFTREAVEAEAEQSLGWLGANDGWIRRDIQGQAFDIRAFPPRMVHILAGNAPIVPPVTIVRGAISKGVHLLKMPSNDMFTATALLRTMADVGPNHPVTRSFSAAYWRGGDTAIEEHIFRSQYFDKLAVWGGEAAVRHAMKYAAAGFEIVSFDPKISISLIGKEAFAGLPIAEIARRSAADIIAFNQDACSCARFQFVEGSLPQVDAYCEALVAEMGKDVRYGNGQGGPRPPEALLDELDMLGNLEPIYRVFGQPDGTGMVVRSSDPVAFNPGGKLVNVVAVSSLAEAIAHVSVATQSVGVYPPGRITQLRDGLSSAGAQRIVGLGNINSGKFGGLPHDGGWPVHRMMHWVVTEAERANTAMNRTHTGPLSLDTYRLLGRSGLRVSPLALGTMTFGEEWGAGEEESRRIFDAYVDQGGNFIDTAGYYAGGVSEDLTGKFAEAKRDRLVLSTKYSLTRSVGDPNAAGNSRRNMMQTVETSLRRLRTDRIDLLFLHVWDDSTPADEIMRAFDDLVTQGKVLYLGLSDTPAWQMARLQTMADLRGWTQFAALQAEYNLVERTAERDLIPAAKALGIGVMPWSPLASGLLSGKYAARSNGEGQDTGGRGAMLAAAGKLDARTLAIADAVQAVADDVGATSAQAAIAWTLANPAVVSPLLGARTMRQYEDNVAALGVSLDLHHLDRLEAASFTPKGFPHEFLATDFIRHGLTAGTKVRPRAS